MTADPAIIEAAARALREADIWVPPRTSEVVLTAVAPLIRAAALEEAAKVVDDCSWTENGIAAAIRTLKEQP